MSGVVSSCGAADQLLTIRQNKAGASQAVCPDCGYVSPWVESVTRALELLGAYHARHNA